MVELWSRPHVRRVLDAVAEEARGTGQVTRFTPGSGGSVLVRLPRVAGPEAILRVARADYPADPHLAADALETLAPLQLRQVPRLLGRGRVAGASWSTESVLPGRRPARLAGSVIDEVASILAGFPRSEEPPTAHDIDLQRLAERFPAWGTVLSQIGEEVRHVALAVPSVIRHGDLWAGNLLARQRRLTGIIDWDAWHPRGLPGVDLLHLVANAEAVRSKEGVGGIWLRRPWESETYRSVTSQYWKVVRIVPNASLLRAVGIAWWAGHVAASIHRLPRLAGDDQWVESNIERVIGDLVGSP
jgi:hypothetical protein